MTTTRPEPDPIPDDERELLTDADEPRPYEDGDRQEDGL